MNGMHESRTHSQRLAADCFTHVSDAKKRLGKKTHDYGILCMRLGPLIQRSGLAQTLAFIEARAVGNDAFKAMAENLAHHLDLKRDGLMTVVREGDLTSYMRHTRRLQNAAVWYRRYAESVLGADLASDSTTGE